MDERSAEDYDYETRDTGPMIIMFIMFELLGLVQGLFVGWLMWG